MASSRSDNDIDMDMKTALNNYKNGGMDSDHYILYLTTKLRECGVGSTDNMLCVSNILRPSFTVAMNKLDMKVMKYIIQNLILSNVSPEQLLTQFLIEYYPSTMRDERDDRQKKEIIDLLLNAGAVSELKDGKGALNPDLIQESMIRYLKQKRDEYNLGIIVERDQMADRYVKGGRKHRRKPKTHRKTTSHRRTKTHRKTRRHSKTRTHRKMKK